MNNKTNPNLALVLIYTFKILHPIGGIVAVCLGYHLFIKGVTGNASLIIDSKDFHGQLINAAPGLIVAFGGLVVLIISAWRGGSISSRPGKHGDILAANETQYPEKQSKPTKESKDDKTKPEEFFVIGPHIPIDYKKWKSKP